MTDDFVTIVFALFASFIVEYQILSCICVTGSMVHRSDYESLFQVKAWTFQYVSIACRLHSSHTVPTVTVNMRLFVLLHKSEVQASIRLGSRHWLFQ